MSLSTKNHDRDAIGKTYVYPVVSRRARGLSVGINLNPNKACNWRCIYCQVPELQRGAGPRIDLPLMEAELYGLLEDVVMGDFLEREVPESLRRLNDVAFSGDGEPTSSPDFSDAVSCVRTVLEDLRLIKKIKVILITNGSLMHKEPVQWGIEQMATMGGEVWFKIDRGNEEAREFVNDASMTQERVLKHLKLCAESCSTRIQTCWFAYDEKPPSVQEEDSYLRMIREILEQQIPIKGVLLYGLARQSHQPEAPHLSALTPEQLNAFADRIRSEGLPTEVSP